MGYVYESLSDEDVQTLIGLKVYMPFGPPRKWSHDKEVNSWLIDLGGRGSSPDPDAIPLHFAFYVDGKLMEFTASKFEKQISSGCCIFIFKISIVEKYAKAKLNDPLVLEKISSAYFPYVNNLNS